MTSTTDHFDDGIESTPKYLAYLDSLAADARRSEERAGRAPPMDWGTELDAEHYFCVPCWFAGSENGAHPYDLPPCELAPRGPFDPR